MKTITMIGFSLLFVLFAFTPITSRFIDQVSAQDISPADDQAVQDIHISYLPYVFKPALSTPAPTPTPPSVDVPEGMIYVDHRSVELFERIPDSYLAGGRNLRMLFADRSVGQNINEALNCLTASSWASSPSSCRRDYYAVQGSTWMWKTFVLDDYVNNRVPERILFSPDPVKYNRSNWTYDWAVGTWDEIVALFVQQLAPQYVNSKDVLSFQFSYLNIQPGTNIASLSDGFLWTCPAITTEAAGCAGISLIWKDWNPDIPTRYLSTGLPAWRAASAPRKGRPSITRCAPTPLKMRRSFLMWQTSSPMMSGVTPATTIAMALNIAQCLELARITQMMASPIRRFARITLPKPMAGTWAASRPGGSGWQRPFGC
jgi:hypothetical protein